MRREIPILADLVFLGGGHAQILAIKKFAMNPLPGLRLTIVTNDLRTPYSGMLPGYIEGVWQDNDIHIDIGKLAQFADARLINAPCTGIDADGKKLFFENRPPLHFDLLSINIGGEPDLNAIEGAQNYIIPVKPISKFQASFELLLQGGLPEKIAVIGGGAAGCELALAINKRWHDHGVTPHITLYSRSDRLLSQMSSRAANLMLTTLYDAGVKLQLGRAVQKIGRTTLYYSPKTGKLLSPIKTSKIVYSQDSYDACFLVSAVRPPSWLSSSTLALDDAGFILVHSTLQSISHPDIFAAGDVTSILGNPRPKAGVFAVRAGRILAKNLRKQLFGQRLKKWKALKRYLAIIGTSDGSAIASWGSIGFKANVLLTLKHWIDRRFISKYQDLSMPTAPPPTPFPGIEAKPDIKLNDPAFAVMRCLGCAAKAGHKVLETALKDAANVARSAGANINFLPDSGIESDVAVLKGSSLDHNLVQSVDMLSEIVSDPFILGRIAAIHALSDLYAALAKPTSALAVINLPEASLTIQTNQLTQILAGGLMALSEAGVKLNGGHTSEGGRLSVGFSVTGLAPNRPSAKIILDEHTVGDNVFVLTKSIGTGVIMAANMQLVAKADWVEAALEQMTKSNQRAASLFTDMNVIAATDITGFGLARHALNLSKRLGAKGCVLNLSAMPLLPGALQLFSSGVRSSLHDQNRDAVAIERHLLGETTEFSAHVEALFDPQTSGGLLGVLSRKNAQKLVKQLNDNGYNAAMIGYLDFTNEFVQLTGHENYPKVG